jgi:SAM-dependent methyltransferase
MYDAYRGDMLRFVPPRTERLLDVGCSSGRWGIDLKNQIHVGELWGIEPELERYAPPPGYDHLVRGSFPDDVPDGIRFSCIVFNDVLEHIADPWQVLRASKALLTSEGLVIASIPNVRHWPVVRDLALRGDWTYRDQGILDRTHLRFFTRSTIIELFGNAGFHIERITAARAITAGRVAKVSRLIGGRLDEFLVIQYGVVARA